MSYNSFQNELIGDEYHGCFNTVRMASKQTLAVGTVHSEFKSLEGNIKPCFDDYRWDDSRAVSIACTLTGWRLHTGALIQLWLAGSVLLNILYNSNHISVPDEFFLNKIINFYFILFFCEHCLVLFNEVIWPWRMIVIAVCILGVIDIVCCWHHIVRNSLANELWIFHKVDSCK